ncbi:hypothetical protein [Chromobacterium sp. IIBBL 290-4]|uniref:hypothetical protein n=1 Tax=Chromobacterium sp. IIBBL 290-4 TaxID=2953890 RepID=UPI0020B7E3A8|nr:hypothetical protein [Chromobacterium sp. IIBBL 290-4]UTH72978.1 hypothetical protein NKT35_15725 [Chromobacterium sp. IIBBL 290-4]
MTDLPALDQLDPQLAALLAQLWRAAQSGDAPWSLARLAKQSGLRMSTLLRSLNLLLEAELAQARIGENSRGRAWLSEHGLACCQVWFGSNASG